MPKGPQGQKRPADTVANAIRVAKILTGEIEEDMGDSDKDKAAQALGKKDYGDSLLDPDRMSHYLFASRHYYLYVYTGSWDAPQHP
jgi:hypothetical protein